MLFCIEYYIGIVFKKSISIRNYFYFYSLAERERLRVTLRSMNEGVITTDTEGIVQFVNEAAADMTGWTLGAAMGRRIGEICALRHERTRAAVVPPFSEALTEGRASDLPAQTVIMHRQGSARLVEGRCAPMHDLTGRVVVITGARVKIGFQASLMLLRSGAKVIATTRFPHDSTLRYQREPDFADWSDRLHIHGLDLRHAPSVELFASHMAHRHPHLLPEDGDAPQRRVHTKALTPVMSRPTMRVWIVSVPS